MTIAARSLTRARRKSRGSWEEILARLVPIDRQRLEEVAFDIIDPSGERRKDVSSAALEATEIWTLIGGWKGIEALENNCAVLIDLAFYVQQSFPEALRVSEELRLHAREIEWQISRLKVAQTTGKLESTIPTYAQQAVATYYLMTRRVLELYGQGNLSMLEELQRAL
ncbi:MAG: hypothetical protein WA634_20585 [Silvibacterium sp.]